MYYMLILEKQSLFPKLFTADKNELMRERLQLEKAKKNKEKTTKTTQDPKVQKKRKNPKDSADQHKKKKKTKDQTQTDKEMQQKEKEKVEKKQKKYEEQTRQKFLLEARKAQATKRWSSTNSELTIVSPLNTSFRPEPLHRANRPSTSPSHQALHPSSTSPHADHQTNHQPSADPTTLPQKAAETPARINTCAQSNRPTTPAHHTDETPTRHTQPMHPTPCTTRQTDETPARKNTSAKNISEPRRGLHFQSTRVMTDSSDNESDEECDATDLGSSASCCRQQKLENEALRKRLEKLHKRLNIACKYFKIMSSL